MQKTEVIESTTVNIELQFCAEVEEGEDTWYFHRFSNYPDRELGGSYDRLLAFKRYEKKMNRMNKAELVTA
jgi:hypothetical protein